MRIDDETIELQCSLRKRVSPMRLGPDGWTGGETRPCPNTATRWTPTEITADGVTTRRFQQPVCDSCDRWHYYANSVEIGEQIDWDTDPRVLRYDREETLARFVRAIENMSD